MDNENLTAEEALDFIKRTAQAIAATFGSSCETLIHDMASPGHPILAIYNPSVSGRSEGSTADIFGDDLGVPSAEGWENTLSDDIVNAFAKTKSGKYIKSSTIHYKGDGWHYALGINYDFSAVNHALSALTDLCSTADSLSSYVGENNPEAGNSLEAILSSCAAEIGIPVSAMNRRDKIRLVAMLEEKGAFDIKNAITDISSQLGISRYTLYKYRHPEGN